MHRKALDKPRYFEFLVHRSGEVMEVDVQLDGGIRVSKPGEAAKKSMGDGAWSDPTIEHLPMLSTSLSSESTSLRNWSRGSSLFWSYRTENLTKCEAMRG